MKKIGILNFQYSHHNYGAVLQAAALEHICRQLGHDAQHIDYMAQPNVSLKGQLGRLLRKLGLRKIPKANQATNEDVFERFRQSFIKRTKPIRSAKEFRATAQGFDAVIVGSDQVWRPEYARDTIAFFLGYVPKGVDRIAYAASFGTAVWERTSDTVLTEMVRNELNQFKAISCREDSGVAICRDVFGVKAEQVLDPLLLVDDKYLSDLTSQTATQTAHKLVYYKLDASPEFEEDLDVIASGIGCPPVNLFREEPGAPEYRDVLDWLALIRRAEFVVTDSFHCICIALRFKKEVIFCPNETRGQTRMDSLFKMLGVEVNRLPTDLKTPMFKLIVKGDLDRILDHERSKSIDFLTTALNQ